MRWIISRGWPRGKSRRWPARGMTRDIFKSAWSLQTATMQPGKWQDEHRPLVDERGNVIGIVSAKVLVHGHHASARWRRAGSCRSPCGRPPSELRGEEPGGTAY